RRVLLDSQGAGRALLEQSRKGRCTEPARARAADEDADSRDPRAPRLPRARFPGARLLQHPQGEARPLAPGVLPRREPLDPEAPELAPVVSRVFRLAEALRLDNWGQTPIVVIGESDRGCRSLAARDRAAKRCGALRLPKIRRRLRN